MIWIAPKFTRSRALDLFLALSMMQYYIIQRISMTVNIDKLTSELFTCKTKLKILVINQT